MKIGIIYKSVHHGNTKRIAEVIVNSLGGDLLDLKDIKADVVKDYDLIGFGSGIFYSKPHKDLMKFVEGLGNVEDKKAFVFSTSGRDKLEFNSMLKEKLSGKGFEIMGEFSCKGFDTWGPFKLIGGLNKGKPDEEDFKSAERFANSLKEKI
ncbi:MAG: flavodoxin family protein [Methanobacterium sp.]